MNPLWKTSKWVRLHDWDWTIQPVRKNQRNWAVRQSQIIPPKFYYQLLRVSEGGGRFDSDGAKIAYYAYSTYAELILDTYETPRSLAHFIRGNMLTDEQRQVITKTLRNLRDLGFLVPADDEEPPDFAAIFRAAVLLYGLWQLPEEFIPTMEIVHRLEPKTVLEIGTAWGGSLFCWAQIAHPNAHLISLDLPGGLDGGGYLPEHAEHFRQFLFPEQELTCLLTDSTKPKAVEMLQDALEGDSVDVLFIDAFHSYEAVKNDFEKFSPFVRPGGVVIFHDIQPAEPDRDLPLEVPQYWNELKLNYEHEEFIHDSTQFGCGLGILYV